MHVEMWPIARVKPYPGNPRINDEAVNAVAASIRQFGWRQPIVVDGRGEIIVGHTRWKAAQRLGYSKVPVHVATDLTLEQIRAYRIADNKLNELAEWNLELLSLELAELQLAEFDLSLLGFETDELHRILGNEARDGLCDPDDIPAPPDAATTQPGQLIALGNHRLLCGDSSNPEHVDHLLGGQPIHLVNTDPPYGVRVEPRSNNATAAGLSSFSGHTHHQGLDVARHPNKLKATTKKNSAPRIGRWPTTSCPRRNSIGCWAHGSATSATSCCLAGDPTSGADMRAARTTRRFSKHTNSTSARR